jgi:hypothetical protein
MAITTNATYAAAIDIPIGVHPTSVAVADFNGDGISDLAVVNSGEATPGKSNSSVIHLKGNYNVSVLLGNGDGSFGSATQFRVGINPSSVVVGDFNGDGKSDLAVSSSGEYFNGSIFVPYGGNISVLLGNGKGSFSSGLIDGTISKNFSVDSRPSSIAVGDFNGDTISDLAVIKTNSSGIGDIGILIGTGKGDFESAISFKAGNSPNTIIAGDFNHDGKSDLAVTNSGSKSLKDDGNVSVLLTKGINKTFNDLFEPVINFTAGLLPSSLKAGDFNKDGNSDLAVTNIGSSLIEGSDTVSVLLGNENGNFGTATNFRLPKSNGSNHPDSLTIGDFNNDGNSDLATANYDSKTTSVLLGNGSGNFETATNFKVGIGPVYLTTGDFNRDGKSDLVTSNLISGNISVLLNTSITVPTTNGGTTLADFKKDPAKYMGAIRDYDGNDLGGSSTWKSLGDVDINGDGKPENILVNPKIERFASVGSVGGNVDFTKHGLNGDTRVVGIYIDPTLLNNPEKIGGPFDSQRRFQNDLKIDNLQVLAAGDYNNDGFQDLYFKIGDGTAVLRALMFKDGNIQYANYQSKSDLAAFMTANNVNNSVWGSWL